MQINKKLNLTFITTSWFYNVSHSLLFCPLFHKNRRKSGIKQGNCQG